jgi:hypothetical protein
MTPLGCAAVVFCVVDYGYTTRVILHCLPCSHTSSQHQLCTQTSMSIRVTAWYDIHYVTKPIRTPHSTNLRHTAPTTTTLQLSKHRLT